MKEELFQNTHLSPLLSPDVALGKAYHQFQNVIAVLAVGPPVSNHFTWTCEVEVVTNQVPHNIILGDDV